MARFVHSQTFAKIAAATIVAAIPAAVLLTANPDYSPFASTNTAVAVGFKVARTGACAVTMKDGSVLITGGRGSAGSLGSAERFSAKNGSLDAPGMSHPRADHACAVLPDGRVLAAGGKTTGGGTVNDAEAFDPKTNSWSPVGPMSSARSGVAAAILPGGKVLLAGGESNGHATATIEVFDPKTNAFKTLPGGLATPRMEHATAALPDGRVLIVGGTDGQNALDTVEVYDDATGMVTPLAARMSTPRQGASATVLLDGRVYIAGGADGKTELATAELLNPKTGQVKPVAPMSVARKGHTAIRVPSNNTVLLVGGNVRGGMVTATEVYIPWKDSYQLFGAPKGKSTAHMSMKAMTPKDTTGLTDPTLPADGQPVMATLGTDKPDYAPGETATITGAGWAPDAVVTLVLARNPKTLDDTTWTAQVDADGNFTTTYLVQDADAGVTFTLTATAQSGNTAQIQTYTFTDNKPASLTIGSQSPATIAAGDQATYVITVAFNGTSSACQVNLATSGLPIGASSSWSTGTGGTGVNPFTVTSDASVTRTLTITTTGTGPTASRTPTGTSTITVTGTPASNCQQSNNVSSTATLVVGTTAQSTTMTVPAVTGTYGGTVTLSATLTSGGAGVSGKTISFTLNGSNAGTATTNTQGIASIQTVSLSSSGTSINAGTYPTGVGASFAGDASYDLSSATALLTVAPKQVTAAVTASNKTYDGTRSATISTCTLTGVLTADAANATCAGSAATFDTAAAGTAKTVTATVSLTGSAAANYALTSTTATTTANIDKKSVTAAVTASNKTYDATTAATITGCTLTGVLATDTANVTCTGSGAAFDTAAAGTGKTVTATVSLSGSAAINYALNSTTATTTANIDRRSVTAAVTASNKTYDATTSATITGCTLTGVLTAEIANVTCTGAGGTFDTAVAGTGKTVTATVSLSGSAASNYALTSTTATTTANIDKKSVTATVTANNKTYDATTSATIATCTLTGVVAVDTANVTCSGSGATFDTAVAGTGKTVTATVSLSGPAAANYALSSTTATTTASIDKKSVTASITVPDKTYDGTASASVTGCAVSGKVGSDDVTCSATNALFASANASATAQNVTATVTLGGGAAGNYTLGANTATTTARINPKDASVAPGPASKTYGSTDPPLTGSLTGFLVADNVTATYSRVAGETAGSYAISATLSPTTVLGNYNIAYGTAQFTINRKPASVTPTASGKTYGDPDPVLGGALNGFLPADGVTAAFGRAPGEAVGSYLISAVLSPAGVLGNYDITSNTAAFVIGARAVTVTADAKSKQYGDQDPTLSYQITGGALMGSDAFTGSLTRVAGEAVDTYAIQQGTLALSANYTLTYVGANLTIAKSAALHGTVSLATTAAHYGEPATVTVTLTPDKINAAAVIQDRTVNSVTTYAGFRAYLVPVGGGTPVLLATCGDTSACGLTTVTDPNTHATSLQATFAGAAPTPGQYKAIVFGDMPDAPYSTLAGKGYIGADTANIVYPTLTSAETLTVSKTAVHVTFSAADKVYDGTDMAVVSNCAVGSGVVGTDQVTCSVSDGHFGSASAGTHTVTATVTLGGTAEAYYTADVGSVSATINKKPASVKPAVASKTYGDVDPTFTGTLTGFISGDNVSGAYSRTAGETVTGGPYTISATLSPTTVLGNYYITYDTASFTISPRGASVTPSAATKVYGSADPTLSGALAGFLAADNVTATYGRTTGETVTGGPYAISATLSPAGVLTNYNVIYNTAEFTITPKSAWVTPAAASKTYGDVDPALTGAVSGFLPADNVTATYSRTLGETVASSPYTISATLSPAGVLSNYSVTYKTAEFTINRKSASVTANAASKTYGSDDPKFSGTLTGFLAADNVTAAYGRTLGESAGDYAISATLSPAGVLGNYNIAYNPAHFTINRKAASVSPGTAAKTYGEADPPLTGSLLGFLPADGVTAAYTRAPGEAAGSYLISPVLSPAEVLGNYDITYNPASLVIAPRAVTVTADAKDKHYGEADPTLTHQITTGALVGSDAFTGSLTRVAGEAVGTYAIQQGTLALSTNYTLTYVGANLTVAKSEKLQGTVSLSTTAAHYGEPATVTVTLTPDKINAAAVIQDKTVNSVTTYAGFRAYLVPVGGGTPILLATCGDTSSCGLTTVTDPNTQATSLQATFSGAAPIPGQYKAVVFGDAPGPEYLPLAGNGYIGADTANIVYPTLISTETLTVDRVPVHVTFTATGRTYDGTKTVAVSNCMVTSGVVGTDNVTCSVADGQVASANVGTQSVVAAITLGGSAADYYTVLSDTVTTTIDKAPASVTPAAASKVYGDADPMLTGTLTGFVSSDNVAATYTRTPGNTVAGGPYTISATLTATAALGNYDITYNTATFTITSRAASVTPNAASKTYADGDPTLTGTLNGFVAADAVAATYARTTGETVAGGPYTISATLAPTGVLSNYNITYNTASFTITKRPASVTPAVASKTYGDADPTLTGILAGFDSQDKVTVSYSRTAGETVAGSPYTISAMLAPAGVLGNYSLTYNTALFTIKQRPVTITADAKTKVLGSADPALTYQITAGSLAFTDLPSGALTRAPGESVGPYAIERGTLTLNANYALTYVGANLTITYAQSGACFGDAGHQILQPVNADGTSVFKQGSTVPVKFRVCDAKGASIGTAGLVINFRQVQTTSGTVVKIIDEAVDSSTPDSLFRWDPTAQQWIFNVNTKTLKAAYTYYYEIALNDGSTIKFNYGLR